MLSSSKKPKSYCIRLASHTFSAICLMADVFTGEDGAVVDPAILEADPPAGRHLVKGILTNGCMTGTVICRFEEI
jgi:hypothetical protein